MKSDEICRDILIRDLAAVSPSGYSSLLASCRGAWDVAIQLLIELERPKTVTFGAVMSCLEAGSYSKLLAEARFERPRAGGRRPVGSSAHAIASMPRASKLNVLESQ